MKHQLSSKLRSLKRQPGTTRPRRVPSPRPDALIEPGDLRHAGSMTPLMLQRLGQEIGNQAVQRLLVSRSLESGQAGFALSILQREDGDTDEAASAVPSVKTPAKAMIDKTKAVEVLQNAFKDYVKKISGGSVEVLSQADFQAAYDKIYGKTKYSWDKYVKPGAGNLEGFAYKGVNYINKDIGSVDVVPHEMLHNNTHASWTPFAGSELDEGTTEYLTIKAVTAEKYTASHSYPDQEGVAQELVKMTSEDLLMKAYFKGETAALKKEMEAKCEGSWSDFKTAMQAKEWVKAKAYLKPKKTK